MTFTVRLLLNHDEASWRKLWAGYLEFYQVELPADHTSALFQRLVSGAPHFAFVVDRDGEVVGFAHAMPHASTWSEGGYCYLEDLFVSRDARGSGAGRALIEAVYAEADKRGCMRVYWHTNTGNKTARALYDKLATLSDFIQYRR